METPKQRKFAEAVFSGRYQFLFYGGAIRGGKSYCVMAIIFILCKLFPGSRWVIVRKDLPTLERNLYPVFYKLRPAFCGKINGRTHTAVCTNGSQIIFFPESWEVDKRYDRWSGLEANGFWLEEARELQETTWNWALQRAGSYIIPGLEIQPIPYIFLTSNPAGNWVKRLFYTPWKNKRLAAPFFYIPATVLDNPYLPQKYLDSLKFMNDRDYKVYVLGDWDLLVGAALEELDEAIHLIPPLRKLPAHWLRFGAFDWGFAHPFSFGLYVASSERIIKVETITGRGMADAKMIAHINEVSELAGLKATDLQYVVAGLDAFHDVQARANIGETTAERFQKAQIPMMKADTSRISGLKNFREMVAWQHTGPEGTPGSPRFVWFDTPANRRCFEQCQSMVLDPDKPEDVLKVDSVEGEGGDDEYDETRYALQSRAQPRTEEEPETEQDHQRPIDYKARKLKPRHRPMPGEDEDLRPHWRIQGLGQSGRVPRFFGEQDFNSEDDDE